MPAPLPPPIHFVDDPSNERALCNEKIYVGTWSTEPGRVTCFRCRTTPAFKAAQLDHEPWTIGQVLADANHDVAELARRAETEAKPRRNERGMYTIEEVIHHGDYRTTRRVEVYSITETTVDAVLQSSAYCYGSWARADAPYAEHRAAVLKALVADLNAGRPNMTIGWSTFRTI